MKPFANARLRFLLAIGALAVVGCSSTPARNDSIAALAVQHALKMQGKPYRYGGNTPAGFDCSGLVQYSYGRAGWRLPHGTQALLKISRSIARSQLQHGDLLFFNEEGKASSHVGIYIGNDRFVHAPSTGKWVQVAALNQPYWRKHFAGVRRLKADLD